MIIVNGYIEPKYRLANPADKDGDGLDDKTGYPIKPTAETVSWGPAIECQFVPNKRNNLGVTNGEAFTVAKYQILVNEEAWPWDSEIIRLTTQFGRVIGEFPIIAVEHLKAVGETQILI